jgi:three-Cys-motif partner protein
MTSSNTDEAPLLPGISLPPKEASERYPEVLLKSVTNRIWTKQKALLIARYLDLFTFVTKHGVYIDGFAGPQYIDNLEQWSARLVLLNKPGRLRKYFLFDKSPRQVRRIREMVKALPPQDVGDNKRQIVTEKGDCNSKILEVLSNNLIRPREASFALLDQRTFECQWQTVVALARYKPQGCNKIERFYFFPSAWFQRAIKNSRKPKQLALIDGWWGSGEWRKLTTLRPWDRMMAMLERFQRELGYKYVTPWPVYEEENGCGVIMYFMIHASDHEEAPKLMRRAYEECVTRRIPVGQMSLAFDSIIDSSLPG